MVTTEYLCICIFAEYIGTVATINFTVLIKMVESITKMEMCFVCKSCEPSKTVTFKESML